MERLECHVKEYAWGKLGRESEVARLFAAGHKNFKLGCTTPYAELWMGTHPDGPARLQTCSTKLSSHIAKSQSASYLSNNNVKENIHLPFIMKIMSIRTTLSLQVHPTKEQAAILHARDPLHYPDRNHKPELAYALTRFELLCGFRPANEILQNLEEFPSLCSLLGEKHCLKLKTAILALEKCQKLDKDSSQHKKSRIALATCFRHMMDMARDYPEKVEDLTENLMTSLDDGVRGCLQEETVAVIRKMSVDFPGDVGIFSPLLLNHMILEPGECCYYAAEELHAYLSGECVECVGCSNNTIRAAMTPKFIDRDALCEVLNYRMTSPEEYLVPPRRLEQFPSVEEYSPDGCKDFQLHKITVTLENCEEAVLPVLECASIMVLVKGCGTVEEECFASSSASCNELSSIEDKARGVSRGDIIYIPPGRRLRFSKCLQNIEAYRTFSYEIGPDHDSRIVVVPSPEPASERPQFEVADSESGIFEVESEMDGFL
ncbi:unnamed protein product [Caenorhabditis auriculariae]|uniref:mannose-6-phosphate isomerase n=1 Tax=Caenorhabditis auriculariae TaxID=2777116 RepID=A0A8S1HY78_9PELO|nr:unnamed protein product [Caenorhabditis auriculariae]